MVINKTLRKGELDRKYLGEWKTREVRIGGHHHCLSGAEGQTQRPRGHKGGDWVRGDRRFWSHPWYDTG